MKPLKGHPYHSKTDAELRYIMTDASVTARCMAGHNVRAEMKYLDQVNDASTILAWRHPQLGGGEHAKPRRRVIKDDLLRGRMANFERALRAILVMPAQDTLVSANMREVARKALENGGR